MKCLVEKNNYLDISTKTIKIFYLMMQVDVGNFLRLKSCVLYTEVENLAEPLVNVEVIAHVTKPELRSSEVNTDIKFSLKEKKNRATCSSNCCLESGFTFPDQILLSA